MDTGGSGAEVTGGSAGGGAAGKDGSEPQMADAGRSEFKADGILVARSRADPR